jgi:hypothetical protein
MTTEPLYSQADKERLLQELEVLTTTGTRVPVAQPDSESVDALHDLFGQVVGLPKEEDLVPPQPMVKGPKMTDKELRAMRGVTATAKVKVPGSGGLMPLFQAVIKSWCAVTGFFADRKTKGAETCEKKRASRDPKSKR